MAISAGLFIKTTVLYTTQIQQKQQTTHSCVFGGHRVERSDGESEWMHTMTAALIFQAVFAEFLSSHLLFSSESLSRLAAFSDLAYILYPGVFEMITALLKYDVNVRKSRLCVLVFRQGLTCIQLWLNGNIGL